MTRLTAYGSDGGIAGDCRTSCLLIDDDILIDAGTGLGDVPNEAMAKIDNIFLSHVHMDHIACLPLLIDTVLLQRQSPVTVHVPAGDETTLMQHVFNGIIWPDFTCIPSPEKPGLRIEPISDTPYEINGRRIGILPVNHHGEAVGFWIEGNEGKLAFTGDTGPCDDFWRAVNELENVRSVVVECSFPNDLEELAINTGHLTPLLMAAGLDMLEEVPEVYATHMKPFAKAKIREEISALSPRYEIGILENGQTINF